MQDERVYQGRNEENTVDGGVGAHVLNEGGCALSVSRISSTVLSPTGHLTQPRLGCASNWFELCLFGVKKASLPDVDSYYEFGGVLRTSLDQTQPTSLLKLEPIDLCVTRFFFYCLPLMQTM